MAHVSPKERALEVVNSLPEDASLEEAIERLCFIAKVQEGLEQSQIDSLVPKGETAAPRPTVVSFRRKRKH